MRQVRTRPVKWLWPGRIPLGKLSIFAGDPGLGKSYLTLDLSARISLGAAWPDQGNSPQGNVLIISAEDGLEDTIRPRLELLEADLRRIHAISTIVRQGDKEVAFSLAEHLSQLEQAIVQHRTVLLVLDPILAFTGKRTDTYKSSEVRAVLAPLATMADRTGCAVLAVLHLNKRSGEMNSIYRITASLDFAAAARSVLVVGKHPEDPNRRVLAPVKTNLSAMPPSLAFRFTEDGTFYWDGLVELDANAVLAPPARGDTDEKFALRDAEHFLLTVLGEGWAESRQVLKEAKDSGISERTLRRAKEDLGVVSKREGIEGKRGGGRWYWRLPETEDLECRPPRCQSLALLIRLAL
jgi:hypothetical protein